MSSSSKGVTDTLKGYARGVGGGLLLSIAPLYTMELWFQGYVLTPWRMLIAAVGIYALLVFYAHYCGVHETRAWKQNLLEAFQIVAIATVIAVVVLKLAGQLPGDITMYELFTRLSVEGAAVAIGVSVGSTQFSGSNSSGSGDENPSGSEGSGGSSSSGEGGSGSEAAGASSDDSGSAKEGSGSSGGSSGGSGSKDDSDETGDPIREIALMVLGALLISFSIAPTQEITMIAVQAAAWQVIVTFLLTIVMGATMVHYAKFKGSERLNQGVEFFRGGIFAGGTAGDAVVTYAVGLTVAAASLFITGMLDQFGLYAALTQVVYLAVPATLGAAAGRLLLS